MCTMRGSRARAATQPVLGQRQRRKKRGRNVIASELYAHIKNRNDGRIASHRTAPQNRKTTGKLPAFLAPSLFRGARPIIMTIGHSLPPSPLCRETCLGWRWSCQRDKWTGRYVRSSSYFLSGNLAHPAFVLPSEDLTSSSSSSSEVLAPQTRPDQTSPVQPSPPQF